MSALIVRLEALPSSDLQWAGPRALALKALAEGRQILWEIDLGLVRRSLSLQDELTFLSATVALDHFSKTLGSEFKEQTKGLILYRGTAHFADLFVWSDELERLFFEWKEELGLGNDPFNLDLYCAQLFADTLHRLISFLPDWVIPSCVIDASSMASSAQLALLLSRERFEFAQFDVEGSSLCFNSTEATLGVCLPSDRQINASTLSILERILRELKGRPFRLIPESMLTQEWHGLDAIVVIEPALTKFGERSLMGFSAAGGKVVKVGKEIGAEGFEPPTHCSQSSCASQTALCSDLLPQTLLNEALLEQ